MRNHIVLGLSAIASVLLCFQNCGMNNGDSGSIDSRLLVTPLADSGISIAQGDNPFSSSQNSSAGSSSSSSSTSSAGASDTGATPVVTPAGGYLPVPNNAISALSVASSPALCTGAYKATDYLAARYGFTYFGTGGLFCQLPSTAGKDRIISSLKLSSNAVCAANEIKAGEISVSSGQGTSAQIKSICIQYQLITAANSYFTQIYVSVLEPSLPALRCKTGDIDAGNIGPQYALCLHR